MFHSRTLRQNLRHKSFWNPQISFSVSHHQLPIFDCCPYRFNLLRCSASCRPSRTWITFNRLLTIFEVFTPHFYLYCTHRIIYENLLNHLKVSGEECSRLTQNLMQIRCYSLSHVQCDSHTVHELPEGHPLPPLTSSEVVSVHARTFQSTLLGCQVTSMLHKQFSLQ